MPIEERSYAITRNHGLVTEKACDGRKYREGCVRTVHGLVEVYSEDAHDRWTGFTSYNIQRGNRQYVYVERRPRSVRGLAVMAGKLARELEG